MLHDSFMEALTTNQAVGQEVLSIITRAITLKHLGRLSTADVKKMEIEWHEAYLLLNDTIAVLEQKRRDLAEINESQYKAKKAAGAARQKAGKFFGSTYFKLVAIIVVVLGATIGVQALGIYDYDNLGNYSALQTPFRWGKYAVRIVKPESPWPNIDVVPRKGYAAWPEGVKPPEIQAGAEKAEGARVVGMRARELNIAEPLYTALNKAVDYREETAEKAGEQPIEIHTFRFANAADAKAAYDIWDKAKTAQRTAPAVLDEMDLVLDTNVVIAIIAHPRELLWKMVSDVYGKKA